MAISNALMSSSSDHWCTPSSVLDVVREFGEIVLDPASNANSIVGAAVEWRGGGLEMDWANHSIGGLVFVNPPYSAIAPWIMNCHDEGIDGAEIVALVPARTDTKWFQHCWRADAICFWRGRIRFLGAPASAPFPSALVYWGDRRARFSRVFGKVGHCVFP